MLTERHPTVLLVEDDPDERDILMIAIARGGPAVEVIQSSDGEAALEWLESRSRGVDYPDLVVTDLSMPKVTGVELIRELRSRPDHSALPVVVLTSSSNDSDVASAFEAGADSYVVKPGDMSHLVSLMRSLLGYWTDDGVRVWTQ